MTAVQNVPLALPTSRLSKRNDVSRSARRRSFIEPHRTDAWDGGIERFIAAPALEPARPKIVVHPMLGPHGGLDVTEAVTRAVAQELWNLHGGNDVMNWLEAERLLSEVLGASGLRTHRA